MKYTRKENVKRAIHFRNPEYIPLFRFGVEYQEITDIMCTPVADLTGDSEGRTKDWGFT